MIVSEDVMAENVYVDLYFFINAVLDLVALLIAGLAASERAKIGRVLAAALLGGAFSVIELFLPIGINLAAGLLFFLPMVLVAYGKRNPKRLFYVSLFAFLTSLFLGGTMEFLSYYAGSGTSGMSFGIFLAALFLSLGAWSLWGKAMRRKMDTLVIALSICRGEKREELYGLIDSGALLKDESGRPVILLKASSVGNLLTREEVEEIRCGVGENTVFLPIRTASGSGVLPAFLPTAVHFHNNKRKKQTKEVLVALDFSEGTFGGCPVLVPLYAL